MGDSIESHILEFESEAVHSVQLPGNTLLADLRLGLVDPIVNG